MTGLAQDWLSQFYAKLADDRESSDALREASLHSDLGMWTATLTDVVVHTFEQLGYSVASKGHRCSVLPVERNEYLGQDIIALPATGTGWRFPVAVCELENAQNIDLVAYALWKVLCIRCDLRVLFCYRADAAAASTLVLQITQNVVKTMPVVTRNNLAGETLLVAGSRNESSTFPYGFFQMWQLNTNIGRFERITRR